MISSLVNATLHTLDDSLLLSANCVLELLDDLEQLDRDHCYSSRHHDFSRISNKAIYQIKYFRENISSRFSLSNNVISVMSIFDPRKAPKADSQTPDLSKYGEEAIGTLLVHYESEKRAETLQGNLTSKGPS